MRQRAHTEYSMVLDSGEALELPFEIDEHTAKWTESEDGLTGYLGAMVHDDNAADPIEDFDNGELVVFDSGKVHYQPRPEIVEFKRLIRANPGLIVTIDLFEHGNSVYKVVAGPFTAADTKPYTGKKYGPCEAEDRLLTASGYYIIPEDATEPLKYAQAQMEEYTNWANGEVYGAWCWKYTRPDTDSEWTLDESSRESECWGFIGYDYACGEREERIAEAIAADKKN